MRKNDVAKPLPPPLRRSFCVPACCAFARCRARDKGACRGGSRAALGPRIEAPLGAGRACRRSPERAAGCGELRHLCGADLPICRKSAFSVLPWRRGVGLDGRVKPPLLGRTPAARFPRRQRRHRASPAMVQAAHPGESRYAPHAFLVPGRCEFIINAPRSSERGLGCSPACPLLKSSSFYLLLRVHEWDTCEETLGGVCPRSPPQSGRVVVAPALE